MESEEEVTKPKVETLEQTDGDVKFKLITVDGTSVPPHLGIMNDGPAERFLNIRNLETREDDILLVSYPKSGSHWVWEIISMLVRGNSEYAPDNKVAYFLEAVPNLDLLKQVNSPRILNTHLPPQWLPKKHIENGGKIVHVLRNPKDVAVSLYYHLKSRDGPGDMNEWKKHMTWDMFFDNVVLGKVKFHDGWFAYEKKIVKAKETDQLKAIHTVQYEKLKKFPEEETRKLAAFLNVTCTDDLIQRIATKCRFDKLKEAQKSIPAGHLRAGKEVVEKMNMKMPKQPSIYRKGIIGDWKNHFTVAQNERFDAYYKEQMAGTNLDLIYEP